MCIRDRCVSIGAELKTSYFALFVQSMFTLTHDQVVATITKCGGKEAWVSQIEALIGHRFQDVAENAPLSAHAMGGVVPSKSEDNGPDLVEGKSD